MGWSHEWYERNKERIAERNRRNYESDPEFHRNRARAWRRANPDKFREQKRRNWPAHYARHREGYRVKKVNWDRDLKAEVITAYGGRCVCCGENTFEFLSIDHVNNDGAAHKRMLKSAKVGQNMYRWLKKHNFPKDGFQLLCMNCNFAKGKYGVCPHVRADLNVVRGMAC